MGRREAALPLTVVGTQPGDAPQLRFSEGLRVEGHGSKVGGRESVCTRMHTGSFSCVQLPFSRKGNTRSEGEVRLKVVKTYLDVRDNYRL